MTMTQCEKLELAVRLLQELNCPESILDQIWIFRIFVNNDEVKLHNWQALSDGDIIEGSAEEL